MKPSFRVYEKDNVITELHIFIDTEADFEKGQRVAVRLHKKDIDVLKAIFVQVES